MDSQSKYIQGTHHVAMRVHDFDQSVAFYTEAMGFAKAMAWGEGDGRAIMLDTGEGSFLELFAGGSAETKPEGAYLHMAYRTNACDEALSRAVAAGATVTMEPADVTIQSSPPQDVRIAFCKGPDGEIIEFFQVK